MVQSTVYELTEAYAPDKVLLSMGFRQRVYLQPESFATLSYVFACSHFQLYRELQGHPVLTSALEHFQANMSESPAEASTIVRSCLGQVAELMHPSVFELPEFHELLRTYDSLLHHDLDRKSLIAYLSVLFHVHIVLMMHTDSAVVCEFAMLTEEAPIVRLEECKGQYGWFQGESTPRLVMRPEELLEWVQSVADPDMFNYYTRLLVQPYPQDDIDPVPAPPINPEPRPEDAIVTELREVAEWQAQYLAFLSPWSPQYALPPQTEIAQLQTRVAELGLSPGPCEALAKVVAMSVPHHPWEECAYVSSELHELPCGHHLCPYHLAHLGQCPWRCPS